MKSVFEILENETFALDALQKELNANGHFRHFSIKRHLAGLWDFLGLCSKLPDRVRFSDIDGVLERHGRFLFIETKSTTNIPRGQYRLLSSLAQQPKTTVVLLVGQPSHPVQMAEVIPGDRLVFHPTTPAEFAAYLGAWWEG